MEFKKAKNSKEWTALLSMSFLLVLLFFVSFRIGRYHVTVKEVIQVFAGFFSGSSTDLPEMTCTVVLKVRTPRIIAAILTGGALAVSGAVYQGLFRNPMVSPDILGASAGAGFGAAIGILFSFPLVLIQGNAFLFGIGAVILSCLICKLVNRGKDAVLLLVLGGMVVSSLFSSLVTLIKYVADTESKLPEITYWLMGSFSTIVSKDVKMLFLPLSIGLVPLFLLRWQLNAMAFGDEEAQSMGLNTKKLRQVYIAAATLLTAGCVAISGMIGWIGLIIPHLARILVGPNYKYLIPASFLTGGIFLLLVDDFARSVFTMELPLGILTSLIGAPFFVYLLIKSRKE